MRAVDTKSSAIYKKYIKPSYESLLSAKDYSEAIGIVEDIFQVNLSRNPFEINNSLNSKITEELFKFSHYFSGRERIFYKELLNRYILFDIKRLLRAIVRGERAVVNLVELPGDFSYDLPSFMEFLKSIGLGEYERKIYSYIHEDRDRMLFFMDMILDRTYYENLVELASGLKNKKEILFLLGVRIDLINLGFIIGAKNYGLNDIEVSNLLIRGGTISNGSLRVSITTGEKFKYEEVFTRRSEFLDVSLKRYLYDLYSSTFKNKEGIVRIVALVGLMEYVSKDYLTLLEGKRLNFRNSTVVSLLARRQYGS